MKSSSRAAIGLSLTLPLMGRYGLLLDRPRFWLCAGRAGAAGCPHETGRRGLSPAL